MSDVVPDRAREESAMDVIQHQDPTGRTMVARWPREGTAAIRLGSQLIVEESQQAVFFRDGKALDTFGPGRHTLATQNIPLLASLFGIPFGGNSPFQAAVVFVSTKTFLDLKWGTKEPVVYRDRELAMVRLRAFGKFAVRVANAQLFVNGVVGTMGLYTTDGVEEYFKDVIVARLTDVLGENLTSIFDLPKLYDELGMGLKARVADDFSKYGIELVDLFLGAITPPEEVQKLIDERSGMGAVGDMNAYLKFKTARAIGDAAAGGRRGERPRRGRHGSGRRRRARHDAAGDDARGHARRRRRAGNQISWLPAGGAGGRRRNARSHDRRGRWNHAGRRRLLLAVRPEAAGRRALLPGLRRQGGRVTGRPA